MSMNKMVSLMVLGAVLAVNPVWAGQGAAQERTVDISKMTCKELMRGNDTDREVGFAFYHGFFAGKKNSQIVNLEDLAAQTDRAKDYCLSNPTATVMEAFTKSAM